MYEKNGFERARTSSFHIRCDIVLIDLDVVFADLVERMFQVVLDVVQAYENETIENRHDIFKVRREIVKGTGKIRSVDYGEYINENFAVSP